MITKLLLHFQTLHLHSRQEEDETVEPITIVPYIRKAYFLRITPSSGYFHLFFSQNGITDIPSSKESSEFMYLASMEVSDQEERRLKQMLSYPVNRVCQKRENLQAFQSHQNADYVYILTNFFNISVFLPTSNSTALF